MNSRWTDRRGLFTWLRALRGARGALGEWVLALSWWALIAPRGNQADDEQAMPLGEDPAAPTYWIRREEPLQERARYHLPY